MTLYAMSQAYNSRLLASTSLTSNTTSDQLKHLQKLNSKDSLTSKRNIPSTPHIQQVVKKIQLGKIKEIKNQAPLSRKPFKNQSNENNGTRTSRKYWQTSHTFRGSKIYQRDDLIDINKRDKMGRTNLERMRKGLAPLGPDGKSINLHHLNQRDKGTIAEMTEFFHKKYTRTIHINPNTTPSGINRDDFNKFRKAYWRDRAKNYEQGNP